jgi:hypothetical protein
MPWFSRRRSFFLKNHFLISFFFICLVGTIINKVRNYLVSWLGVPLYDLKCFLGWLNFKQHFRFSIWSLRSSSDVNFSAKFYSIGLKRTLEQAWF